MSGGSVVRQMLYELFGLHVYRTPPRGTSLASDLRVFLPNFSPSLIWDVGANIGQSTAEYRKMFPDVRIVAFEPAPSAAKLWTEQHGRDDRARLVGIGLGSRPRTAFVSADDGAVNSQITDVACGDPIEIDTVDNFAGADRIDFLKIDTEGHDLEVLRGAQGNLAASRIAVVQVEAGMNPDNDFHCPFEHLKSYLEAFGYRLFGLYEQAREFPTGQPQLRRTNAVFISPVVVADNTVAMRHG